MANIDSLPPEIILRIFEEGALSLEESDSFFSLQPRYDFLLSASLVKRGWDAIAKVLLWVKLDLREGERAKKVLANSAFGRFQTTSLSIAGNYRKQGCDRDEIVRLVRGVAGTRELKLRHVGKSSQLDFTLFESTTLQGLTSLKLSQVYLHGTVNTVFSFSLSHLDLDEYFTNAPFSSQTLQSLSITSFDQYNPEYHRTDSVDLKAQNEDANTLLTSISPQLVAVRVHLSNRFALSLTACHILQRLTLTSHPNILLSTLSAITCPLKHVTFISCDQAPITLKILKEVVEKRPPSVANLCTLRLSYMYRSLCVEFGAAFTDLVVGCWENGINLVLEDDIGADIDYFYEE